MQTYQNLTDQELIIPNVGLIPPHGTIQTDLELNSPNLQPINHQPAPHVPEPESVQVIPEPSQEGEH